MTAISDYLEDALLEQLLRNGTSVVIPTVYLALFETPGLTDSSVDPYPTEIVDGTAYMVRPSVAFDAPSSGSAANTDLIQIGPATTPWGDVTHVAIMDSATPTEGNVLFHGVLTSARTVSTDDTFSVAAGSLVVTLT